MLIHIPSYPYIEILSWENDDHPLALGVAIPCSPVDAASCTTPRRLLRSTERAVAAGRLRHRYRQAGEMGFQCRRIAVCLGPKGSAQIDLEKVVVDPQIM